MLLLAYAELTNQPQVDSYFEVGLVCYYFVF